MDSDLGAKVKKLRIAHGLTQEDVAKALDVTPGYISNVENGRNLMTSSSNCPLTWALPMNAL